MKTTPFAIRDSVIDTYEPRLVYLRDLVRELVMMDLKIRYKRSILGIAWSLLNPLAELLVLSFVFRFVFNLNIPNWIPFLYTGLLAWSWFRSSLTAGTGAIVQNRRLLRLPGFPVAILPVISTISNMIHFLLSLPILLVFILISHLPVTEALFALPLVVSIQFALTIGLMYFLAAVHVTFRDTQYLLGIFLMLGFYLSPIFYDVDRIPARYQGIYHLNPMVSLIESYRAILLEGSFPAILPLLAIGVVSLALVGLGYRFFKRTSIHFAEEL
jgi:lipopolysaccharide transport system permease protein